jgi:PAS domain-containing protein
VDLPYEYIAPVLVAIISGFVAIWVANQQARGQTKRELTKAEIEDQAKFRQQLMEQYDRIVHRLDVTEEKYKECEKEHRETREELRQVKALLSVKMDELSVMNTYIENMPGPAWLKDTEGNMIFINDAYEIQWGVMKFQYEGRNDKEVWPKTIADEFYENDQQVINGRKTIRTVELVPKYALKPIDLKTNPAEEWHIWKWPVLDNGGVIGVAGVAFRKTGGV